MTERKQVKLRVMGMHESLRTKELENAVFVKSKAFLNWKNVNFVRLETGFVCKLEEDISIDSLYWVAIPKLLRSKYMVDDLRDSLGIGDETILTAVDPESVDTASLLRVAVSSPVPLHTEHVIVNREEVIEAIHRCCRGHILTKDAVLGIVVNKRELHVQVTDMESLTFTQLKMAKIGECTTVRVISALGLYRVTLLTEVNDPKDAAKTNETKDASKTNETKDAAKTNETNDAAKTNETKSKAEDHDAAKSSEALTSEAMKVFCALVSIIQYESECTSPERMDAMEDASTILGCRLKQIAKEMERRTA